MLQLLALGHQCGQGMPDEVGRQRFERALSAEAYTAAWRFCCRLASGRHDAEDLLQDALARAYQRFGQLREPAKFKSWLLSIVRRCFLMQRRRAMRRPRAVTEYADVEAKPAADAFQAVVLSALASLPEAQRALLTLTYLEDHSATEAAEVLGFRPSAARMRLTRARRALRQRVEQLLAAEGEGTQSPEPAKLLRRR
jgi:RNA polymerase sigma-70 factor (ECF subfamily)